MKVNSLYPYSFNSIFNKKQKKCPHEMTQTERADYFSREIRKNYQSLKKLGNFLFKECSTLLLLGKSENYKRSKYGEKGVTFGEISKDTNLPKEISIWGSEGLESVYEITSDYPSEFSVTDYEKNKRTFYSLKGRNIREVKEIDFENNYIKTFRINEEGFVYQEGIKNTQNELAQLKRQVIHVFSKPHEFRYSEY